MKLSSLSVKRRPVKKGAFRTLFANVARKKHRAATAVAAPMPEMEGDVPNLGIARALVVILIIHVVAIAGIFAHSHFFEGDAAKAAVAEKELLEPVREQPAAAANLPQIATGEDFHIVKTGDTYEKIAMANGVEVADLRRVNDNTALSADLILRIPARTIVATEPEELIRLRNGSAVLETDTTVETVVGSTLPVDDLRSAPMVETDAAAQLVRPNVTRGVEAARPVEQAGAPAASAASGTKYTVKNGDTFWKIAKANGTTPDAIMKANRITDPRKLRPGMQLIVP
jgi:LysM repeat protein